jgi:peptidylprolyl isomerase
VGVGRDLSPDTGTGGELYAVIGHAPRQLDRVIAVVGRVVEGIDRLSSLPRGTEALGFYKDKAQYVPIARIRLASQIPAAERPAFEVMDTNSATFADYLRVRANRKDDFYIRPAGGVDLCNVSVPVRRKPS